MSEKIDTIFFKEIQRFKQLWLWLIVIALGGGAWYIFVKQILIGEPFGFNPAPDIIVWIIWFIFGIFFPLFFYSIKMIVEVRESSIYIRFFPFFTRIIPFKDIKHCMVRTYKPIREYGGWGIRRSPAKGWAYNISGNRGVQLELIDGEKILIGSQKPEELFHIIELIIK